MGQVGNWEYDIAARTFWGSDEAKRIYGYDLDGNDLAREEVESCILELDRVRQVLRDLIGGKKAYDLVFEIQPIDGSPKKTVRTVAGVILDEGGVPRKVAGVIQDITEQKKAEEERIALERQLKESQRLESLGKLAGGIAHDFNNILSSIIGFTELSLDDVERDSIMEDNLQEIHTAGKRARDLVKQILAFARRSEEETRPIQVDLIVREVLKLIRSSIPTTIEIKQNIDSDSVIMGNQTQVHQMMMNLCTNAAHAMEKDGGVLTVSLTDIALDRSSNRKGLELQEGDYVELTVNDTGGGISPDILDSIFEPYFTTKRQGEGTGMGLAMVRGLVESYGGMIAVDSTLGEGTTFSIYLPITRKRRSHRAYESEDVPTGTERILVVDDESQIARMVRKVLETLGYSVTARTSSLEALKLFQAEPDAFDLVVTDMTMPKMTGDKLSAELMRIRPDIPVILCTGYSKMISDELAEDLGVKALLTKPIVKADLAKAIRKVLDT